MKLIFVPLSSFLPHSKKGRFVCAFGLALEMRSTVRFFGFRNDAHIYFFDVIVTSTAKNSYSRSKIALLTEKDY